MHPILSHSASLRLCGLIAVILSSIVSAADDDPAELKFKIAPNEMLKYAWTIATKSETKGKEQGKDFSIAADTHLSQTLVIRGQAAAKDDHLPVALRIQDMVFTDKRSIGEAVKTELYAQKGKMKYVEDGKVIIDTENDIGSDKLGDFQQYLKAFESAEVRAVLDGRGKQSDVQGDTLLVDQLSGGQSIFPILPGKGMKPGESWDDNVQMEKIKDFKLAKPATIRSRMTFAKWEVKDGRRLAMIDYVAAWDTADLKGENAEGVLVEISNVRGRNIGTCLFDPAIGRFVNGSVEISMSYHLDGEHNGQKTGVDVSEKHKYSFEQIVKK